MIPYNHPYSGRKCSRPSRFPARLPDETRAITSALPGIQDFGCDRAPVLPAGNRRARASILYRTASLIQSQRVTMCRDLTIQIEMVKPDCAETDRMCKSDDLNLLAVRHKGRNGDDT